MSVGSWFSPLFTFSRGNTWSMRRRNGYPARCGTNRAKPPGTKRDRSACPYGVAFCFGFRIYAGVRGTLDERVGEYPRRGARPDGCTGWFREVFPHEHEETVPVVFEEHRITTERHIVERVPVAPELVRAWLPLETYPISAGIKGGLAGGVAMAVLACTYGLLKAGSIWYPINLLAATV